MHIQEKSLIQVVSGHGYLFLFGVGLFGLLIDLLHSYRIPGVGFQYFGILLILLGTLLTLWAQYSSNKHRNSWLMENIKAAHFYHGPYMHMKSPTHVGIAVMLLGFGFCLASLSVVLAVVFASLFLKVSFLRKHEAILLKQFGTAYDEYRKRVKF